MHASGFWRFRRGPCLTTALMDRTPVIVGIGLSDYPVTPHLDSVQHHVLAMQRALADAGIEKSEIDGYASAGGMMMAGDPVYMAEYLRIDHRYVDDVLESRMIADPLHLFDCCAITDGGGAFVMTTAERAQDLPQRPVYVLGAAGGETHWNVGQQPDFTTCAGARAGPEALGRAGIT